MKKNGSFNTLYVVGSKVLLLKQFIFVLSFNTLYVVGSILTCYQYLLIHRCFNTLYVVGSNLSHYHTGSTEGAFQYIICRWFKHNLLVSYNKLKLFQYIICRWFKISKTTKQDVLDFVSIHYMSLVQRIFWSIWSIWNIVSIHYMSLVQTSYCYL